MDGNWGKFVAYVLAACAALCAGVGLLIAWIF